MPPKVIYLSDLHNDIQELYVREERMAEDSRIMINVAGRWTNIKDVTYNAENDTIFVNTED